MIRSSIADLPNVEAELHCGLLAEYAREKGARILVKGVRGAADFAMGLAATSKPESRDAAVLSAEFALAGALLNASLDRLSEADAQTFEARKTAYRFAVSDFENVWAARCGLGGLWEASAKLRDARAEFFQK